MHLSGVVYKGYTILNNFSIKSKSSGATLKMSASNCSLSDLKISAPIGSVSARKAPNGSISDMPSSRSGSAMGQTSAVCKGRLAMGQTVLECQGRR